MPRLAEKGNEAAIAAVTARLKHQDSNVREAAVRALPKVAEKGNEVAIAAVAARLEDRASDVREAAVSVLAFCLHFLSFRHKSPKASDRSEAQDPRPKD